MKEIKIDCIIKIHEILITQTGGMPGIRDLNLLDSAINSIYQSFGEKEFYNTIKRKAARLCSGIAKNHPFTDGNKRTAILAMLTFLEINNINLICKDEELVKIGVKLANNNFDYEQLADWIVSHS